MRFPILLSIALTVALSGCFPQHKKDDGVQPVIDGTVYNANDTAKAPVPTPPETKLWVGDSYVFLGAWANWFPGSVNAGVGGNTVGQVLERVQGMDTVPATVYVWCGINDINAGVPRAVTVDQYGTLIDTLKAKGAVEVICLSPMPVEQVFIYLYHSDATPGNVGFLVEQEEVIAGQHGARFINLWPAVQGADGWCDPTYGMPSGIHLNAQGYDRVVALLQQTSN